MELFGIILAGPAAFFLTMAYCALLPKFLGHFEVARHPLYATSVLVLVLSSVEVLLLIAIGAVQTRAALGPIYYAAHVALFFLGTPALANVLILRGNSPSTFRLYLTYTACAFFAVFLVVTQYTVSEALYGVDGGRGRYS